MLRVLVTRPELAGNRTAARLKELGFEPVLLPLSQTRPLPVDANLLPERATAVAITSANAIRHASQDLLDRLTRLPCYAVGKKTAASARAAGFSTVLEGAGDATALAGQITGLASVGAVVYLCGRVRNEEFEKQLKGAGIRVHPIESYDTVRIDYKCEAIVERLSGGAVNVILLYSTMAAAAMKELTGRAGVSHLFESAQFYCLSGRVSLPLEDIARDKILVAREPNEQALLTLLPLRY